MIICSCNVISDKRIQRIIDSLRISQPDTLLTPGKVYKKLGCRPSCGSCLTQISKMIHAEPADAEPQDKPSTKRRTKSATVSQFAQASL